MLGISITKNLVNQNIANCQPVNQKQADQLGIDTKIDGQLVEKFASFHANVDKYDRAASESYDQQFNKLFANLPNSQEIQINMAYQASQKAVEKISEVQEYRLQSGIEARKQRIIDWALDNLELFKMKSYNGDYICFKRIVETSQGKFNDLYSNLDINFSEVFLRAAQILDELVKDSPEYPELLSMILSSQLITESQYNELQDAPAKLMNKAAHSQNAMRCFKQLLNSGKIRLEDFAERAIELDPSSAIVTLLKLALGNSRKDQRLTIVNLLSKVAKEQTGTMGGSLAAKGLKKIIKSEGQNGILKAAFNGLKESAKAGNAQSMKALKELAEDPTISMNKAFMAIECLTDIAKSSSNAGGAATDILIDVANNKKLSTKVRFKSVDGLTDIVKSGNANAGKASDALLKLARTPEDPVGNKALKNILNLQDTEKFDQNNLAKVMFGAAKNKKLGNKTRLSAYNKLEHVYDNKGAGSNMAKGLIINLARNPHDPVGKKALHKVA
ncbi:MAG: hypothetical protein AB1782_10250, partial [Cyanobacteriota bacterium]